MSGILINVGVDTGSSYSKIDTLSTKLQSVPSQKDVKINVTADAAALTEVRSSLDTLAKSSMDTADTTRKMLADIQRGMSDMTAQMRNMGTGGETAFKKLGSSVDAVGSSLKSVTSGFKALITVVASGALVKSINDAAGSAQDLQNRLSLVTGSYQDMLSLQAKLSVVARETRSSLAGIADVFVPMSLALKSQGMAEERMVSIVRTIQQASVMSGSAPESIKAGLVQLSQGLSAGTIRGEELNSVMEQMQYLSLGLQKQLGMNGAELRQFATEGRLTSQMFAELVEKMKATTDADFAKFAPTVAQGWERVSVAISGVVSSLSMTTGSSARFASLLFDIGDGIESMGKSADLALANLMSSVASGGGVASGIGSLVADVMKELRDGVVNTDFSWIGNSLVSAISSGFSLGAMVNIEDFKDAVMGVFTGLGSAVSSIFSGIFNPLITAFPVLDRLVAGFEILGHLAESFLHKITLSAGDAVDSIRNIFHIVPEHGVAEAPMRFFKTGLNKAEESRDSAVQSINDMLRVPTVDSFKDGAEDAFKDFTSVSNSAIDEMGSVAAKAAQDVKTRLYKAIDGYAMQNIVTMGDSHLMGMLGVGTVSTSAGLAAGLAFERMLDMGKHYIDALVDYMRPAMARIQTGTTQLLVGMHIYEPVMEAASKVADAIMYGLTHSLEGMTSVLNGVMDTVIGVLIFAFGGFYAKIFAGLATLGGAGGVALDALRVPLEALAEGVGSTLQHMTLTGLVDGVANAALFIGDMSASLFDGFFKGMFGDFGAELVSWVPGLNILTNSALHAMLGIAGAIALIHKGTRGALKEFVMGSEKKSSYGLVDYFSLQPKTAANGSQYKDINPKIMGAAAGAAFMSAFVSSVSMLEAASLGIPLALFALFGKSGGSAIVQRQIDVATTMVSAGASRMKNAFMNSSLANSAHAPAVLAMLNTFSVAAPSRIIDASAALSASVAAATANFTKNRDAYISGKMGFFTALKNHDATMSALPLPPSPFKTGVGGRQIDTRLPVWSGSQSMTPTPIMSLGDASANMLMSLGLLSDSWKAGLTKIGSLTDAMLPKLAASLSMFAQGTGSAIYNGIAAGFAALTLRLPTMLSRIGNMISGMRTATLGIVTAVGQLGAYVGRVGGTAATSVFSTSSLFDSFNNFTTALKDAARLSFSTITDLLRNKLKHIGMAAAGIAAMGYAGEGKSAVDNGKMMIDNALQDFGLAKKDMFDSSKETRLYSNLAGANLSPEVLNDPALKGKVNAPDLTSLVAQIDFSKVSDREMKGLLELTNKYSQAVYDVNQKKLEGSEIDKEELDTLSKIQHQVETQLGKRAIKAKGSLQDMVDAQFQVSMHDDFLQSVPTTFKGLFENYDRLSSAKQSELVKAWNEAVTYSKLSAGKSVDRKNLKAIEAAAKDSPLYKRNIEELTAVQENMRRSSATDAQKVFLAAREKELLAENAKIMDKFHSAGTFSDKAAFSKDKLFQVLTESSSDALAAKMKQELSMKLSTADGIQKQFGTDFGDKYSKFYMSQSSIDRMSAISGESSDLLQSANAPTTITQADRERYLRRIRELGSEAQGRYNFASGGGNSVGGSQTFTGKLLGLGDTVGLFSGALKGGHSLAQMFKEASQQLSIFTEQKNQAFADGDLSRVNALTLAIAGLTKGLHALFTSSTQSFGSLEKGLGLTSTHVVALNGASQSVKDRYMDKLKALNLADQAVANSPGGATDDQLRAQVNARVSAERQRLVVEANGMKNAAGNKLANTLAMGTEIPSHIMANSGAMRKYLGVLQQVADATATLAVAEDNLANGTGLERNVTTAAATLKSALRTKDLMSQDVTYNASGLLASIQSAGVALSELDFAKMGEGAKQSLLGLAHQLQDIDRGMSNYDMSSAAMTSSLIAKSETLAKMAKIITDAFMQSSESIKGAMEGIGLKFSMLFKLSAEGLQRAMKLATDLEKLKQLIKYGDAKDVPVLSKQQFDLENEMAKVQRSANDTSLGGAVTNVNAAFGGGFNSDMLSALPANLRNAMRESAVHLGDLRQDAETANAPMSPALRDMLSSSDSLGKIVSNLQKATDETANADIATLTKLAGDKLGTQYTSADMKRLGEKGRSGIDVANLVEAFKAIAEHPALSPDTAKILDKLTSKDASLADIVPNAFKQLQADIESGKDGGKVAAGTVSAADGIKYAVDRQLLQGLPSNRQGALLSNMLSNKGDASPNYSRGTVDHMNGLADGLDNANKALKAAMSDPSVDPSEVDRLKAVYARLRDDASDYVKGMEDIANAGMVAGKKLRDDMASDFNKNFKSWITGQAKTGDFMHSLIDTFTDSVVSMFTESFTKNLLGPSSPLGQMIKGFGEDLMNMLMGLFSGVPGTAGGASGGMAGGLASLFGGGTGSIGNYFASSADSEMMSSLGYSGFMTFATGGHVSGAGNGTSDSIPAMVSNGEFVVNASATKDNLGLLHAINNGSLSKFATGGLVGGDPASSLSLVAAPAYVPVASTQVQSGGGSGTTVNMSVTGDISRQTRAEIMQMIPHISAGVNQYNKSRGYR